MHLSQFILQGGDSDNYGWVTAMVIAVLVFGALIVLFYNFMRKQKKARERNGQNIDLLKKNEDVKSGEAHMIHFKCSQCGKTLAVLEEHSGEKVRCPACKTVQTVPEESEVPTASVVDSGAMPQKLFSFFLAPNWELDALRFLGPTLFIVMILLAIGNLTMAIVLLASRYGDQLWWAAIPMFFSFLISPLWGLWYWAGCKYANTLDKHINTLQRSVDKIGENKQG
jgi:phage FluMu protein Com